MKQPARKPWTRKMEDEYLQSTWRFQQRLVKAMLVPAPFALAFLLYWRITEQKGYPPLLVWAVLFGSIGFTLGTAFFFWRCPYCNELLFQTSRRNARFLFWLNDPDICPDCGAQLKGERPVPRRWK